MKKITDQVIAFRNERNWGGNHDAKNLAISISLEASELLENFQWRNAEEAVAASLENIKEEMADVLIYLVQMADVLNIDLEEEVEKKLKKNAIKYPVPN